MQVKTLSKRNPVPLGASLDKIMGDYWIIVSAVLANSTVLVLRPDEVWERAHSSEKEGRVSFWL